MVEKQQNIDDAMKVLKECDLLKIEDILPFFPDFVTIDKFKVLTTRFCFLYTLCNYLPCYPSLFLYEVFIFNYNMFFIMY